jgi:hypothetical protein
MTSISEEHDINHRGIGLDSNVLTYLVDAMTYGYDPGADADETLRAERVGALRVFLYIGNLFVSPTAHAEIERILTHLLTLDADLQRVLAGHTAVDIVTTSQFWEDLEVPRDSTPRLEPKTDNPLSKVEWWRW